MAVRLDCECALGLSSKRKENPHYRRGRFGWKHQIMTKIYPLLLNIFPGKGPPNVLNYTFSVLSTEKKTVDLLERGTAYFLTPCVRSDPPMSNDPWLRTEITSVRTKEELQWCEHLILDTQIFVVLVFPASFLRKMFVFSKCWKSCFTPFLQFSRFSDCWTSGRWLKTKSTFSLFLMEVPEFLHSAAHLVVMAVGMSGGFWC